VREVWASTGEFGRKIIRRWYFVAIGVVGGVLGIVNAVAAAAAKPGATPFSVPLWVWLSMLAGGFLFAIIWAFHDVRMERDAVAAELKRRLESLRYALAFTEFGARMQPNTGRTAWDVDVWFKLANSSSEPLWYTAEDMANVIDGRRSDKKYDEAVHGDFIPPRGDRTLLCLPVRGVSVPWETASLEFTIRYGHPEGQLRHRMSQTYRLTPPRETMGLPPGQNLTLDAQLVKDSGVEDIGEEQSGTARQAAH
jgi:hypothetical protein